MAGVELGHTAHILSPGELGPKVRTRLEDFIVIWQGDFRLNLKNISIFTFQICLLLKYQLLMYLIKLINRLEKNKKLALSLVQLESHGCRYLFNSVPLAWKVEQIGQMSCGLILIVHRPCDPSPQVCV